MNECADGFLSIEGSIKSPLMDRNRGKKLAERSVRFLEESLSEKLLYWQLLGSGLVSEVV